MSKILIFVGTRPECIKTLPVFLELKKNNLNVKICDTGQHTQMNDEVFSFFNIKRDYKLDVLYNGQSLQDLTSKIISKSQLIISKFKPDFVFVHGDTMTSMACAISSFLSKVKICHIEAGLRTNNKLSPFPEEMNRRLISHLSDIHFAPTKIARQNLVKENINPKNIHEVGNSAMDALVYAQSKQKNNFNKSKYIVVTIHRRENHGINLKLICDEIRKIAINNKDVKIIFPVHPNPNIKNHVNQKLKNISNISLVDPLEYGEFINLLLNANIIITDSGGIQEEATFLGIPTLVIREFTERPEAINNGPCILFPDIIDKVSYECDKLLNDKIYYKDRSIKSNVFGSGKTSNKIYNIINKVII